jgi:ADP-ribose pyrophosphatase
MEETGYDGDLKFIGTCLDDAYSSMVRYCYVATNCTKVGKPQQTPTERIEVVLLPLAEFRTRLRQGKMTDVEVGYLGLDFLHLL